jgi:purine nucleoside phosphorylase
VLKLEKEINEALDSIKTVINESKIGIILAPGFEEIAYGIEDFDIISCCDIPNFPNDTSDEDANGFFVGNLQGKKVIVISVTSYDCISRVNEKSTFIMEILKKTGVKNLIVINSAVSVNEEIKPTEVVIAKDRINISDKENGIEDNFTCSDEMLKIVKEIARIVNVEVKEATYGYSFDKSQKKIVQVENVEISKADIVGMPTLFEFISSTYDMNSFHLSYIMNRGTKIEDYINACSKEFVIPEELKTKYTSLLHEIIAVL